MSSNVDPSWAVGWHRACWGSVVPRLPPGPLRWPSKLVFAAGLEAGLGCWRNKGYVSVPSVRWSGWPSVCLCLSPSFLSFLVIYYRLGNLKCLEKGRRSKILNPFETARWAEKHRPSQSWRCRRESWAVPTSRGGGQLWEREGGSLQDPSV